MTLAPRQISSRERRFILFIDRIIMFIGKYWLAMVSSFLFIFSALPFLAPVLMHYNITAPADLIYRGYSLTCHQMSYRSYFFYGEQPVYTIAELRALVPGGQDQDATSFFWRNYIGDTKLGYKMAWCERDVSIYIAMMVAFIVLGFLGARAPKLNLRAYLLFVVPMAIDGTWQLITSPIHLIPFIPPHESNAELRLITGAIFGIGSVWLVFPYVREAMVDAYAQAKAQYERGKAHEEELKRTSATH